MYQPKYLNVNICQENNTISLLMNVNLSDGDFRNSENYKIFSEIYGDSPTLEFTKE